MQPTKKLRKALYTEKLIATADLEAGSFVELEKCMVSHICSGNERPPTVMWFDGECIENPGDYQSLIEEFIEASECREMLQSVSCSVDFDKKTAACSATKNSEHISASWVQNSDWVENDFLEFAIGLCSSDKGGFVYLDSGDQTYLTVFMGKELLASFNRYKNKELKSRDGFFTGQDAQTKSRYGDIEILARDRYNFVLNRFKSTFLKDSGSVSNGRDYREGQALEVAYVGRYADAFSAYSLLHTLQLQTPWYATMDEYGYDALCPDEMCNYLNLDAAHDHIIFQYEAKSVPDLMGDMPQHLGNYLIVGSSNEWAICVKERSLIAVGKAVTERLKPLVKSVEHNRIASFFDWFSEQHYRPLLQRLGYELTGTYANIWSKHQASVMSAFFMSAKQEHPDSPLLFRLNIGLHCRKIETMLGEAGTLPEYSFNFAKRYAKDALENCWSIDSEDSFDRVATEIKARITELAGWADGPISYADLISTYENEQSNKRIAAATQAAADGGLFA